MSGFSEREKGFEKKFEKDQEVNFKVTARRNKLLGLWAAAKLGLAADAADAYAKDVVAADFDRPGDDDVIEKIVKDFAAKSVAVPESQIRDELTRAAVEARKQIMGG